MDGQFDEDQPVRLPMAVARRRGFLPAYGSSFGGAFNFLQKVYLKGELSGLWADAVHRRVMTGGLVMKISESTVDQVWKRGREITGYDPTRWRRDECGAWMYRDDYGNNQSEFGWHIEAVCSGAPHQAADLRPFQHQNGYDRANHAAHCIVTAVTSDSASSPSLPR